MLIRTAIIVTFTLGLAACASPGYRGDYGYGYRYDDRPARCLDCGVVTRIERVHGERRASGAGAVAGAVVGGALGNQIGDGSGRRAATVAGAVLGGLAGNRIEKDVRSAPRYEIFVRMDDGRRLVLSQRELGGVREGARVVVQGNRVRLI